MMYMENLEAEQECRRVTQSRMRGESYYANDGRPGNEKETDFFYAFAKEVLYRDMKTTGFMMEYPHGIVVRQAERNHYYRGEKQIYKKSQASVYRAMDELKSDLDKAIYKMVADMRVGEFAGFLFRMGFVQYWAREVGSVLYEPLAQHYGLETEWLDITSDFNVALFFATCGWDSKKKMWFPLTKKETEQNEKTKYGVLFHIPSWNASMKLSSEVLTGGQDEYIWNSILPIGIQPFMRCQYQNGYGIHMEKAYCPLQEDIAFEKLYFRHNEKLSRDVFDLMEQGKKIYPEEGLNDFQDVIDVIKKATAFSDEAFQYALKKSNYFTEEESCEKALAESCLFGSPIQIIGERHPYSVSRQRIRNFNRKCVGLSVEGMCGVKPSARWVYKPSD